LNKVRSWSRQRRQGKHGANIIVYYKATTNTHYRRYNLAIHKISQAAKSPNPAAVFDVAVAVRYADNFQLSQEETRQLEQYLHGLVIKANDIIEFAFLVTKSWQYISSFRAWSEGEDEEAWRKACINTTADRAHFDASVLNYFTYMRIPNDLPWDTEDHDAMGSSGGHAMLPHISVVDISDEWLEALAKYYGASA